jgi:hypothetical protein
VSGQSGRRGKIKSLDVGRVLYTPDAPGAAGLREEVVMTLAIRVKVYNARLALIVFYNARPVSNARTTNRVA